MSNKFVWDIGDIELSTIDDLDDATPKSKAVVTIEQKGGAGSGHHGHAGLPGVHGGSAPGTGGARSVSTEAQTRARREKTWRKMAMDGSIGPTRNGKAPPLHDDYFKYKSDAGAEDFLNNTHDLGYDSDWQNASNDTRGKVKDAVVTQLATDTGQKYVHVNEALATWAYSSNDHSVDALLMQQAAASEFDLELSDWQKGNIDTVVGTSKGSSFLSVDEKRTFLRTMYANTQANFAKQGFKGTDTITLYRGFKTTKQTIGGSLTITTRELVPHLGKTIDWQGNAMESWSSSRSVAGNFGNNVIAMEVPIRNIIGSCVTGFGCLNEAEFVVAGTKGNKARIIRAGGYSIGEPVPEYVLSEIAEGFMD